MSQLLVLRSIQMHVPPLKQPVLILIRGLPGSGKSYVAAALGEELTSNAPILLDPDATDYTSQEYRAFVERATADGVDPALHAYRFLRAQAHTGITAKQIIIWNQPFTNRDIFRKMTAGLLQYAREAGSELTILVVEVILPEAVAQSRVEQRLQQGGHGPSAATFERFVHEYETFANEGFVTIQIDGQINATESVTKIKSKLDKLIKTE